MLKYNFFRLLPLLCIPLIFSSLNGQEQLTNFQGAPCCYNFEEVIQSGDEVYGIATDHQDGVKIYSLNGLDAELVFSNHNDDKTYLYDHGTRDDFYYFVFNDRLELFQFDDSELDVHPFETALEENRDREGIFYMSEHGLLVVPEFSGAPMQFFSLEAGKFEPLENTVSRAQKKVQLDSFIFSSKVENGEMVLFSHNIVTDEIHNIYTSDDMNLDFAIKNGVLYFYNLDEIYVSKGKLSNTYFLNEFNYRFDEILAYEKNDTVHTFVSVDQEEFYYYQFVWGEKFIDSIHIESIYTVGRANHFYRINEEEIFLANRQDFFKVNIRNDSISVIENDRHSDLIIDSAHAYYDGGRLMAFHFASDQEEVITDYYLQPYIHQLYKINDSLFYIIGKEGHSALSDDLKGLFAIDISIDSMVPMLKFGDNVSGNPELSLQKVGQKLLLRTAENISEFNGQEFENVTRSSNEFPIIHHKGDYYIITYTDELRVSLIKWDDQEQLIPIVEDIPYYFRSGRFINTEDHLYTVNTFGAFLMDIENQKYDTLSPYKDIDVDIGYKVPGDNYILITLRKANREEEIWSYNLHEQSWVKLQLTKDDITHIDPSTIEIVDDHAIGVKYFGEEPGVLGISLISGEKEVLIAQNIMNSSSNFYFMPSCGAQSVILQINNDSKEQILWRTNGMASGTQKLLELDPSRYYSYFYEFEGDLYFTAFDSVYTKAFSLDCENASIDNLSWMDPFIPHAHYRVGEQLFALGNQLDPKQNLTLTKIENNDLLEVKVSPHEFGSGTYYGIGDESQQVPAVVIGDSLLAISASFDKKGEELWLIHSEQQLKRITDLNEGPFDSQIRNLVIHDGYIYFTAYKYGPGYQVWRMPIPDDFIPPDPEVGNEELTLFPNPVKKYFRIKNSPKGAGELRIFDSYGKMIYKSRKAEGNSSPEYDVRYFPEGVYFMNLSVGEESYSSIFVKVQ